jgi:hypothetical protein
MMVFCIISRAFPNVKAQAAGYRVTAQLTRLALCGPSISRKCHESVMGFVMGSETLTHT